MSQPKALFSSEMLAVVCGRVTNRDGLLADTNPCGFSGQLASVVPEENLGHGHDFIFLSSSPPHSGTRGWHSAG